MDFWKFSLAFYGTDDVRRSCLALQEECGADVNVLLYLLWQARSGTFLDAAEIKALDDRVRPWRDGVVKPLRTARRTLKLEFLPDTEGQEALRNRVKAVELSAEKAQQEWMSGSDLFVKDEAHRLGDPAAAARMSLDAYGTFLDVEIHPDYLDVLLQRFRTLPSIAV